MPILWVVHGTYQDICHIAHTVDSNFSYTPFGNFFFNPEDIPYTASGGREDHSTIKLAHLASSRVQKFAQTSLYPNVPIVEMRSHFDPLPEAPL
jgi:hypothetical protein